MVVTGEGDRIARRVRSGETTAIAEAEAALERAEAHSELNAFIRLDPDAAIRLARKVDEAVATGADPGPLAGVPIALKDLVDQEGIPTTAGSSFLRDPAVSDAAVTTRLIGAGAVVVGRTGLHEFAYGFSSENDWWGPVRNPWDPKTSPGGSSGGSAAAVAAGIVPIGIGTDTGGSVRVPAALCGVVGLKVTHGRVPLTGVFPLAASLDSVGPITFSVRDAATAYSVLAGHDPHDPWSQDHPVDPVDPVAIDGMRIGVPHPWVDRPVADEQAEGLAHARETLEAAGAEVFDLEAPGIDERDIGRIGSSLYHEVADVHRRWYTEDPTRYGPAIRDRLEPLMDLTDEEIAAGRAWRVRLRCHFADAFRACDLLLTPATAARAKRIGRATLDVGAGDEPYRPVLSWFTPLVNQAGLPALALPIEAPSVAGLPPSIQLVGPGWSEAKLLGLGIELDRLGLVAHRRPPGVSPAHG